MCEHEYEHEYEHEHEHEHEPEQIYPKHRFPYGLPHHAYEYREYKPPMTKEEELDILKEVKV